MADIPLKSSHYDALESPRTEWAQTGLTIRDVAVVLIYVSLATIFLWIGLMKFTAYEAKGIEQFAVNSPLTSWLYSVFSLQGASNLIGIYEIAAGTLILSRVFSPRLSAIGGVLSVVTFLVTMSFMLTTPGVGAPEAGGFPALSAAVGQFLAKDTVLFAASVFILGESLVATAGAKLAR